MLPELTISLSKLRMYCKENGGYDLESTAGHVTLSFVPNFPEANEKGDPAEQPPRITMHGLLRRGKVTFSRVVIEDSAGTHDKEIEDAKMTYRSWLDFIEENF